MSATIETTEGTRAGREWWELAGQKERLDESIQRARRDADVPRLFELQEQARDLEKRIVQARAASLAEAIKEGEAEAARLQELEAEQLEEMAAINAKLTELRDAAEQLEGSFNELNFAREATQNRLLLVRREVETRRGELRALVEGV
jgi:chromosome segregation ATPase